jgi:hypothetical protein
MRTLDTSCQQHGAHDDTTTLLDIAIGFLLWCVLLHILFMAKKAFIAPTPNVNGTRCNTDEVPPPAGRLTLQQHRWEPNSRLLLQLTCRKHPSCVHAMPYSPLARYPRHGHGGHDCHGHGGHDCEICFADPKQTHL